VDANCEIPPEKEALVFEEIASLDFDFNGKTLISPDYKHLNPSKPE
jgi:hypothetical protein